MPSRRRPFRVPVVGVVLFFLLMSGLVLATLAVRAQTDNRSQAASIGRDLPSKLPWGLPGVPLPNASARPETKPTTCNFQPLCVEGLPNKDVAVVKCALPQTLAAYCPTSPDTSKGPYACNKVYTLGDTRYGTQTFQDKGSVQYNIPVMDNMIPVGVEITMTDNNKNYSYISKIGANSGKQYALQSSCGTKNGGTDVCGTTTHNFVLSTAQQKSDFLQWVTLNFANNDKKDTTGKVTVSKVNWKFIVNCNAIYSNVGHSEPTPTPKLSKPLPIFQ